MSENQAKKLKATARLLGVRPSDILRDLLEHSLPDCSVHKEFLDEIKSVLIEGPVKPTFSYVATLLGMKTLSPWQVEYKGEKYDVEVVEISGFAAKLRVIQQLFNVMSER